MMKHSIQKDTTLAVHTSWLCNKCCRSEKRANTGAGCICRLKNICSVIGAGVMIQLGVLSLIGGGDRRCCDIFLVECISRSRLAIDDSIFNMFARSLPIANAQPNNL